MEPPVDVDAVTQRAQRYWIEDGLVEIMLGLLFLLMGAGSLARLALPRWLSLDLLTSALTVVGALGLTWGFKKLKEQISFPRCGYVALPQPTRMSRAVMFAMVAGFGAIFSLLLSGNGLAVPLVAVSLGMAFVVAGFQARVPRMIWEGTLTLIFGAFLYWFTHLSASKGVLALMAMIGASTAIIGALQLRRFLKANPRREETEA